MLLIYIIIYRFIAVICYSNKLFTATKHRSTERVDICFTNEKDVKKYDPDILVDAFLGTPDNTTPPWNFSFMTENKIEEDPIETYRNILYRFLFGEDYSSYKMIINNNQTKSETYNLLHNPTGRALRKAELFNGKIGVHIPIAELIHRGQCMLQVTNDYMQTAIDAFTIFAEGELEDIKRLPADYVLNSARTISMMKISNEKLAVTWTIIKGSRNPIEITYYTLEKYRPLFKYLSGKEMAKLNLSDQRILNFIGTHPDLNRHQVGLVASKYIKMNPRWSEAKYLNSMNNLLCGVPITYMREILENTYLQLSHQVFYHTRACDPLQRRFYLGMMTRTQALGKSYSWNAQDVSRLGLLLAEVEGEDLGSIKPEALAGLTAQVVTAMRPENLQHLTDVQLRYIREKPFNILSKKLKIYKEQNFSAGVKHMPIFCIVFLDLLIKLLIHT